MSGERNKIQPRIWLAKAFSDKLGEELTVGQMMRVIALNIHAAPNVCHSHDFCDANMFMADAFRETIGHDVDPNNEADASLWNDAWEIAKAAKFFI